jgi:cell division protein FtsZ
MGVRGVTDLMVNPGVVNLDFADIRTVMAEMGKAMMGTGEAEGEDRAVKASEAAISNPLLEDTSMQGARGVLINITGGHDMTLFEVDEAANRIRKEVDEDANIIFGSSIDETMNGRIRVSVVATGIDAAAAVEAEAPARPEGLTVVAGGRAATPPPAPVVVAATPAGPAPRRAGGGAATVLRAAAVAQPDAAPAQAPVVLAAAAEAAEPVLAPRAVAPEPAARQPAVPPTGMAAPAATGVGGGIGNLFRRVTGATSSGFMKRNLADVPAAPRVDPAPPQVAPAPTVRATAPVSRPAQQDEIGLDIPTFLRRQSN